MYIPKPFEITDEEEIFAFVEDNAFGQLISTVNGRLFSTHLPFLLSKDKTKMIGHLALPNPQHTEINRVSVIDFWPKSTQSRHLQGLTPGKQL